MTENLGNIRYTEEAALHPGAVFQPVPSEEEGEEASTSPTFLLRAGLPRLLVTDTGQGALDQMEEEAADYTCLLYTSKNMMWEKDGLSYTMMTSADKTLEEMAELAKAYIDSEK